MTYWLQELQQKRWEYCNNLDVAKWDSRSAPASGGEYPKGLVARDNTGEPHMVRGGGQWEESGHSPWWWVKMYPEGKLEEKCPMGKHRSLQLQSFMFRLNGDLGVRQGQHQGQ